MVANKKPGQERDELEAWCSLLQAPIIAQRVFWAAVLCGAADPEGWSSVQRERDLIFKILYGVKMGRPEFRGAAASLADRGLIRLQAGDKGACTLWVTGGPTQQGPPLLGAFSEVGQRRATSFIFKFLEEDQTLQGLVPSLRIKNCADLLRFSDSAIGSGCAGHGFKNHENNKEKWANSALADLPVPGGSGGGEADPPPRPGKNTAQNQIAQPPLPGNSGAEAEVELQLCGGLPSNGGRVQGGKLFAPGADDCGDRGAAAATPPDLPPLQGASKPQEQHEVLQYNLPGLQSNSAKTVDSRKPKRPREVLCANKLESNAKHQKDEIKKKDELCEAKQWKTVADLARALVEFWRVRTGRSVAICTEKRKQMVRDRINDGFKPSELFMAVAGLAQSPWHRDKGYTDFDLALRTPERIERCHDYWHRYAPIERLIAHYDRIGKPCPVRHDEVRAHHAQQAQAAYMQERLERTRREQTAQAEAKRKQEEEEEQFTNALIKQYEQEKAKQEG